MLTYGSDFGELTQFARMGYAVLHLEKAKGTDSGMSAHIERTIQPKNADPKRTHLNRELIQFPDGVSNIHATIVPIVQTERKKQKGGVRAMIKQAYHCSFSLTKTLI